MIFSFKFIFVILLLRAMDVVDLQNSTKNVSRPLKPFEFMAMVRYQVDLEAKFDPAWNGYSICSYRYGSRKDARADPGLVPLNPQIGDCTQGALYLYWEGRYKFPDVEEQYIDKCKKYRTDIDQSYETTNYLRINKTKRLNLLNLYSGSINGDSMYGTHLTQAEHNKTRKERFNHVMMRDFYFQYFGLGLHDFDEGLAGVVQLLKEPFSRVERFKSWKKILVSNMDISRISEETIKEADVLKYAVVELTLYGICESTTTKPNHREGSLDLEIKIGILGCITTLAPYITNTHNIIFHDEVLSIRKEATLLRTQRGVDMIIVLAHGPMDMMDRLYDDGSAEVIIASTAYRHTFGPKRIQKDPYIRRHGRNKNGSNRNHYLIYPRDDTLRSLDAMRAFIYFSPDKTFLRWKTMPIPLANITYRYPLWSDYYSGYFNTELKNESDRKPQLGAWTKVIINNENHQCCYAECSLGNYIADAMVDYVADKHHGPHWTDASIALIDAGCIGQSIGAPLKELYPVNSYWPVDRPDIMYAALTRKNAKLQKMTITGTMLKELLETSIIYNIFSRNFFQMAGLRVVYDYRNKPMNRVISMSALCADCPFPVYQPVSSKNKYRIIIPVSTATIVTNCSRILRRATNIEIITSDKRKSVTLDGVDGILLQQVERYGGMIFAEEDRRIVIIPSPTSPPPTSSNTKMIHNYIIFQFTLTFINYNIS